MERKLVRRPPDPCWLVRDLGEPNCQVLDARWQARDDGCPATSERGTISERLLARVKAIVGESVPGTRWDFALSMEIGWVGLAWNRIGVDAKEFKGINIRAALIRRTALPRPRESLGWVKDA